MTELASIEVADAVDLLRLRNAAAGLSEDGVAAALVWIGLNADRGLAGVPKSRVAFACSSLVAAFRSDVIEPLDARTAFERPSATGASAVR